VNVGSTEALLSRVLSEFARTMVTDFPIQGILDHLVERIVDILPITAAGVTLISPGMDPRYVAASDASALRFETLQTELAEGPCLLAYETDAAVAVADLRDDPRFPTFGPRAVEAGLLAVFTFPLRHGHEQLGALDLYRGSPGLLDAVTMDAAQTLADVAAAYLLNAQARADLRDASDQAQEMAHHDALTGLPNRLLLLERLDHAVLRGRRSGKLAAVLFADLDHFKIVNDLYGHSVGDELLVMVARRLTAALRPGDTLARLSGDEFVILCEELDSAEEAGAIAARIGAAIGEPFILTGAEVVVTASIGIAFTGQHEGASAQLLDDADVAMYQAKRAGGARHQIVDLRELHHADQRARLEVDLRSASVRGELRAEYQAIVESAHGRVIGVEGLLRWEHPVRGLLLPAVLVPLAEQAGVVADVGRWILTKACVDRRRWQEQRTEASDLGISVNTSSFQLMSPDCVDSIATVLHATGTDPALLTLDVTESAFFHDSGRALVVLTDLKHLGVKLALDGFGTGYSSLTHLARFPIDIVKIDRELVAALDGDEASRAIVVTAVDFAHRLGMTVVAEGVETVAQWAQVASLGCDACQGYLFGRPTSADDMSALLGRSPLGAPWPSTDARPLR
jgi:diguanylate cyclase (GGDEF)-like protein